MIEGRLLVGRNGHGVRRRAAFGRCAGRRDHGRRHRLACARIDHRDGSGRAGQRAAVAAGGVQRHHGRLALDGNSLQAAGAGGHFGAPGHAREIIDRHAVAGLAALQLGQAAHDLAVLAAPLQHQFGRRLPSGAGVAFVEVHRFDGDGVAGGGRRTVEPVGHAGGGGAGQAQRQGGDQGARGKGDASGRSHGRRVVSVTMQCSIGPAYIL